MLVSCFSLATGRVVGQNDRLGICNQHFFLLWGSVSVSSKPRHTLFFSTRESGLYFFLILIFLSVLLRHNWHIPLSLSLSLSLYAEVGCHVLLQGIFLTQGSNPCFLHLPVFTDGFFTSPLHSHLSQLREFMSGSPHFLVALTELSPPGLELGNRCSE